MRVCIKERGLTAAFTSLKAAEVVEIVGATMGRGYNRIDPHYRKPWSTMIKFVPQQEAWVVERFGRYSRTLEPGVNLLVPFIDDVRYVHVLKEIAVDIEAQTAITSDNVAINLDGVLYVRVHDPYKASYGIANPQFAVTQLGELEVG